MTKFTTADCIAKIDEAYRAHEMRSIMEANYSGTGYLNLKWKRQSKTGRKGSPIIRVFSSFCSFLQATVVEENGELTVKFNFLPEYLYNPGDPNDFDIDEINQFFIDRYMLPFNPGDFSFVLGTDEQGKIAIVLSLRKDPEFDKHVLIPDDMLPYCADGLAADCLLELCWTVTGKTQNRIYSEMLMLGYKYSSKDQEAFSDGFNNSTGK